MLAIPISVISQNFTREYALHQRREIASAQQARRVAEKLSWRSHASNGALDELSNGNEQAANNRPNNNRMLTPMSETEAEDTKTEDHCCEGRGGTTGGSTGASAEPASEERHSEAEYVRTRLNNSGLPDDVLVMDENGIAVWNQKYNKRILQKRVRVTLQESLKDLNAQIRRSILAEAEAAKARGWDLVQNVVDGNWREPITREDFEVWDEIFVDV